MFANGALVRHDRCVAPKSLALTIFGGRGEAVGLPCFADQRDRGAGRNHAGGPARAPIFREAHRNARRVAKIKMLSGKAGTTAPRFGEVGNVSNGAIKARVVTIAAVTGRPLL